MTTTIANTKKPTAVATQIKIDETLISSVRNMQQTLEEYESQTSIGDNAGDLSFALIQAAYYDHLKSQMTPAVVKALRKLEGNKLLGYTTDGRNYTDDQIRDALLEAVMSGGRVVGGEITIIAGGGYLGKEAIRRKIERIPGVSHLDTHTGAPEPISNKTAAVAARATWLHNGERCECKMIQTEDGDFRAMVKMDVAKDGRVTSGVDQLKGKAESKLLRQVYKQITGRNLPDVEPDVVEGQVVSGESQTVNEKIVEGLEEVANEINWDNTMNDLLIEAKDDLIANQEHGTLGVQNRATHWKTKAASTLPGNMVAEAVGEIDSIVEDICQAIRSARGERSN